MDSDDARAPLPTLRALALGTAGPALRGALGPAAAALGALALAGAALGGSGGPVGTPAAAVGPAAMVAAPAVVLLAAALLFARVAACTAAAGRLWRDLQARGASPLQVVLLAGGLPALLILALGIALPLPVTLVGALLPIHAGGLLRAWGVALPAAVVLAALALAAAAAALADAGAHVRQGDVSVVPLWRRFFGDVALLVVGIALALGARTAAGAPPALSLAGLGAAAFGLGAALLCVRAVGALANRWERHSPGLAPAAVLALRAAARGGGGARPIALGALAAFACVLALTGGPAVASTTAGLRAGSIGADVHLRATWARPCGPCTGYAASFRGWPLPPVSGAVAALPGVSATATLVAVEDAIEGGAVGRLNTTLVGESGGPAPGRGAVLSRAVAAAAGLHAGSRVQSGLLGEVAVVGVSPTWPGIGPTVTNWMVVNWSALSGPLQARGAWTPAGFSADVLLWLQPGGDSGPAIAALKARQVQVADVRLGTGAPAGAGTLPWVLWPLVLLAALLWWYGRGTLGEDARSLPTGQVAVATASASATPAARALLASIGAPVGALVGCLAGAAAALLVWPVLAVYTAPGVPLHVPPVGLGLAVVAAAALAYTVWHVARRQLKTAPDAEIAARLDRLAEDRPEPPAVPLPVPHLRWAPAGRAGDRRRRLTVATVVALLIPAGKRLGAHWPRLLGLFAGLLLAAAVAATVPLYVAGSLTRVLHAGLTPVNSRPAGATLLAYYPPAGAPFSQADLQRLGAVAAAAGSAVGLPATPVTTYTATGNGNVSTLATPGLRAPIQPYVGTMTIDALSGLAAHVQVTSGRMYTDAPRPDGAIEVVADESAVQAMHLELGRLYRFAPAGAGPALTVQLVGVTRQVEPTGPYWPYRYYHSDFLTAPRVLAQLLGAGEVGFGEAAWYCTLDMRQLNAESVPAVLGSLQRFGLHVAGTVAGAKLDVSPYKVLADFVTRAQTLQALLRLVSIPVIALALYFVAITASLIVAAEEAEIAVYVSRGAGAAHILALYLFEWCMLAVPVAAIAPFPAALFAAAMGAASGFLHFVPRPPLPVLLTRADFVYAAATALVGVGTALVPVVAALGRSIVAQRLRTSRTVEQPLWQRAYLDLAALAVLGVLWLLFRGAALQPGAGAAAIAADPALYLLPAAFLAVSGLLVVRLVGWCLRTLDLAVGPWASPGLVLPLRRIGRLPAQFAPVLLLLCFTAALGSYSAAAARTLDANLTAAVQYRVGAPVRLQEVSPCITMTPEVGACVTYDNAPIGPTGTRPMPPFDLHQQIPGIAGATELLTETVAVSSAPGQPQATLVLVDPDTYANVGWWMNGLNPQTLDWYMQQLRDRPNAVFFSRSLTQTARIGDHGPVELTDQITAKTAAFQAVGGVDLWPGAGLSGPFAVANLHYALSAFGIAESSRIALLRLQPGARVADVVSALGDRAIFVGSQDQAAPEVTAALATPEWAGQSGMLSVGFLVALCVTILGYLFYAALLLRGQLSQLGLLRALGLPWRQLVGTVAAEQGTLLLSGAAAGTLAGLIAAALFLPLFRPAFSGPYSPPFIASGPGAALAEVALVMLGLLAVALGALLLLLRRMHVGETVKLED